MNKLSSKAIEARKAYQREWRKTNKDKIRIYQANYWNKKAEELEATKL